MNRVAVIMAGGSGERFWPASRLRRPKQLLRLADPERTLLEQAVARIAPLVGPENVIVATGAPIRDAIVEANLVPEANVWAEPSKKNTLGCLSWAAANFEAGGKNPTWAVLTADHSISDEEAFRKCVEIAFSAAEQTGGLVTLGIPPSRPDTGFGYIEVGETVGPGVSNVARFHEKPDEITAREYLRAGRFLWNSGMFFWTQDAFLRELNAHRPGVFGLIRALAEAIRAGDGARAAEVFEAHPSESVDYALMENTRSAYVVRATFGWDDLGAWDSLRRSLPLDPAGNAFVGDVLSLESRNNVVYAEIEGLKVCLLGVEDLVLAVTPDALLLTTAQRSQDVRKIVEELKKRGGPV